MYLYLRYKVLYILFYPLYSHLINIEFDLPESNVDFSVLFNGKTKGKNEENNKQLQRTVTFG